MVKVGICRIRRIRKKLGLHCKQKRKFKAKTPNQVWVSDITYIPTEESWLYLAGHKDIFTGEVVGYAMGSRLTKNLISQSLLRALATKRPEIGLIQFGMHASMSRKGNCYDNAPMESFWGTLKNELVHHRCYATRQQAISEITEYIEVFYNRQRRQAKLGYLSPAQYERQFYAGQVAV